MLSTGLINFRLPIILSLQRLVTHVPQALSAFTSITPSLPRVSCLQLVSAVTSMTLLHRSDETYPQPQVITVATLILLGVRCNSLFVRIRQNFH